MLLSQCPQAYVTGDVFVFDELRIVLPGPLGHDLSFTIEWPCQVEARREWSWGRGRSRALLPAEEVRRYTL